MNNIEANKTNISDNSMGVSTVYNAEMNEKKYYIAIEDVRRLSDVKFHSKLKWNVINNVITDTNWNDVFKHSDINVSSEYLMGD